MQRMADIRNPQLAMEVRQARAAELLAAGGSDVQLMLYLELGISRDVSTQTAIVRALATLPVQANVPPIFLPLLLELFNESDEGLNTLLAAALGRYEDETSLAAIQAAALSDHRPMAMRLGAVSALARHRTQTSAAVLMRLIETDQPAAIRDAAFDGLARIAGLDLGPNPGDWQAWWSRWRSLSVHGWNKAIQENQQAKYDRLSQEHQRVQDRLVESQRQLYRATAADQRPALLMTMLSDPLQAIRLLGITLSNTLLGEKGPAGIDKPLRQAILARLQDPWPEIRRRAALLARDLAEESAADQIAQILIAGQEQRPDLLKAYLQVMAQMPRTSAMAAVVKPMADPSLQAEACQALAAAAEVGRLPSHLEPAIRTYWRQQITQPRFSPSPALVRLLGHVGQEPEWDRIQQWLDASDPLVRQAAALAWSRSEHSLELLLPRCDDPAIYSALLTAAAKRGSDARVLGHIASHKPASASLQSAWRLALEGMASRCSASAVMRIQDALQAAGEPSSLRVAVLSRAIDHYLPATSAGSTASQPSPAWQEDGKEPSGESGGLAIGDLLLARAEIRLAENDPRAVLADAQRLAAHRLPINQAQQSAWMRLTLRSHLASGEWDSLASELKELANHPDHFGDASQTSGLWALTIQTVERYLATAQPELARQLLSMVDQAWAGRSPASQPLVAQRARLRQLLFTPPGSSSQPVTGASEGP